MRNPCSLHTGRSEHDKVKLGTVMGTELYNVVFYGDIIAGHEAGDVENKLAARFKIDRKAVAKVFSGQRFIIKARIDYQRASEYKAAFEKAGAICYIEEFAEKLPEEARAESHISSDAQTPVESGKPTRKTSRWAKVLLMLIVIAIGAIVAIWYFWPAGRAMLQEYIPFLTKILPQN